VPGGLDEVCARKNAVDVFLQRQHAGQQRVRCEQEKVSGLFSASENKPGTFSGLPEQSGSSLLPNTAGGSPGGCLVSPSRRCLSSLSSSFFFRGNDESNVCLIQTAYLVRLLLTGHRFEY
jgi:hypothetical protein